MHTGLIYAYPNYIGQVQSLNLLRRHRQHLAKHPDWSMPIILEVVDGKSKEDLIFNLAWAETIWMFKLHTYKPVWSAGLNKMLPASKDYEVIGKLGGGIRNMSDKSTKRMMSGTGVTRDARARHKRGCKKGGLASAKIVSKRILNDAGRAVLVSNGKRRSYNITKA